MRIVSDTRQGWDVDILKSTLHGCTNAVSKNHNKSPKGKKMPYGTYIYHAPGVPWSERAMNGIMDRLLLVPNIPTTPPYGSTAPGRFNHLPPPASSSGSNSNNTNTTPSPSHGLTQSRGRGQGGRGAPRGSSSRGRGFPPRGGNVGSMQTDFLPPAYPRMHPPAASQFSAQPFGFMANGAMSQQTPSVTNYWPESMPSVALPGTSSSANPASHGLQQQFSASTLFAPPDAGPFSNYASTSSSRGYDASMYHGSSNPFHYEQ